MGRNKAPTTDLSPGSLPADHLLVQLGVPKGSNNFLCTDTDGIERLVELGTKIRKTVLATRGDFAIIKLFPPDPASKKSGKDESTGSLAGELVFVASNKDVRDWKKAGEWPAGFGEGPAPPPAPVTDQDAEAEEHGESEHSEDGEDEQETPAQ